MSNVNLLGLPVSFLVALLTIVLRQIWIQQCQKVYSCPCKDSLNHGAHGLKNKKVLLIMGTTTFNNLHVGYA